MGLTFRFESEGRTDTGRVRGHNEDSLLCRPEIGLWAVADGMGGHERGEWASAEVTAALAGIAFSPSDDFDARMTAIFAAIHAANAKIFVEAALRHIQMGTTVVVLLVHEDQFGVVWAGDSRAYLLRDRELHQLSVDHTEVQRMLDLGLLKPEEARGHPMGHVLARAIGVTETVELDAIADSTKAGDRFLLCSDGLTAVISEGELPALVAAGSLPQVADLLVERTLGGGAPDNVTVALVDAREATVLILGGAIGGMA